MKRASVLRVSCAMIGTSLSFFGCSPDTNPTIPLGGPASEAGAPSEHFMPPLPDGGGSPTPAADAAKDAAAGKDAGAAVVDAVPPPLVKVTILGLTSSGGWDGGAGATSADGGALLPTADGGAGAEIVVAKSSRLAPTVRVEVVSRGGDPMADLLASVKAGLIMTTGSTMVASATLNQTQYGIGPGPESRSYLFSDTPLDVSKVAPDVYDLQVVATTSGGASGTASVRIYLDGGPTVTFLRPADRSYVKDSIMVTAAVTERRSEIASVGFSIGQYPIEPSAVASAGGQYTVTIDFASYTPPLDGEQMVTVTATNSAGVTTIATRRFTIDRVGPEISATKPAVGDLIGKVIIIEAKVDDPAGVMGSSVVAVVAHGDIHFEVPLVKGADGTYRQLFDTTQLPVYAIFPTISFRAQDVLGNQASVGYLVSLDNTPPVMDLDPPETFRLYKKDGTCSWPFDPVGPDAIDDGSIVSQQLFDIRARIEDRGNTPITGIPDFVPIAAVDPDSVHVLILDDTSLPLVVDTSDPPDGICDDINPEVIPSVSPKSAKEAQLIRMVTLSANAGAGDFTPQPGVACSGNDSKAPDPICATTYSPLKGKGLTYYLGYSGGLLPAIYTLEPIVSNKLECAGRQFDASNNLSDGWACVAVEASDKMGNKQVSRPIRICVAAMPDSTACSTAALGGADIASVTLPSSILGRVVVGTQTPLLGSGGAALKEGDSIVLTKVSPLPFASINGTHTIRPQGTGGTTFVLTDLSLSPAQLWVDKMDGSAPTLKGKVGLVAQKNAELQVVTDQAGTALDPDFTGKVIVLSSGMTPGSGAQRWSVNSILPAGFKLTGSQLAQLTGSVIAASRLPDCTGTTIKQASGAAPVVDATKPCRPWLSYPDFEGYVLN